MPQELIHHRMPDLVPTGGTGVGPQGPGCVVDRPGYDKSPELSVLTSMFLHGGWLHLLGSMLFLWIFGNNVEDRMGHVRYLLFYVVCGYAAAYGFALLNAGSGDPPIGASGAVAGMLGAHLVLYPLAYRALPATVEKLHARRFRYTDLPDPQLHRFRHPPSRRRDGHLGTAPADVRQYLFRTVAVDRHPLATPGKFASRPIIQESANCSVKLTIL